MEHIQEVFKSTLLEIRGIYYQRYEYVELTEDALMLTIYAQGEIAHVLLEDFLGHEAGLDLAPALVAALCGRIAYHKEACRLIAQSRRTFFHIVGRHGHSGSITFCFDVIDRPALIRYSERKKANYRVDKNPFKGPRFLGLQGYGDDRFAQNRPGLITEEEHISFWRFQIHRGCYRHYVHQISLQLAGNYQLTSEKPFGGQCLISRAFRQYELLHSKSRAGLDEQISMFLTQSKAPNANSFTKRYLMHMAFEPKAKIHWAIVNTTEQLKEEQVRIIKPGVHKWTESISLFGNILHASQRISDELGYFSADEKVFVSAGKPGKNAVRCIKLMLENDFVYSAHVGYRAGGYCFIFEETSEKAQDLLDDLLYSDQIPHQETNDYLFLSSTTVYDVPIVN